MLRVPTWILSLFGLLFGLYHAVLGVIWISENDRPELVVLALIAYLAILASTLNIRQTREMSSKLAWINIAVCAVIPIAIQSQLDPSHLGDYATWYVLGVGTILATTAVRGRRAQAWIGLAILIIEIAIWGGVASLASTGLPGVLSLMVTGHAVSLGVSRAVKNAQELNRKAALTAIETASLEAAGQVRSNLLEKTLRTALPALNLIAALGGNLDADQKREALLMEAGLRDEIRGESLLNDEVRLAIKEARIRGVEVLVLDEGGLQDLPSQQVDDLLSWVARSVKLVESGRLTIRSPKGEDWKITFVAVRPGASAPDIWLKLS
jgi:hypothetical protein